MWVPDWLQTLRALRPTHVMQALPTGSPLLLLNPRDLRRADPAPLPRVRVPARFLLEPLLRAARDADALLGLSPLGVGPGPGVGRFAGALMAAAEEVGFGAPLFMATPPLHAPASGEPGDRLRDEIQRYLDAGFTEIVLAAVAGPSVASLESLDVALDTVRERELPLTLAAATADDAALLLETLVSGGLEPDLVALGSASGAGALGAAGIELPLVEARSGIQGVDLSAPIAAVAGEISDSSDAASQARAEALVYAEAFQMLGAEPFRGSAARAMRALAERPGY